MAEYIERDVLKERFRKRIKWLEKDVHDQYSLGLFHGCEYDADLINEPPAADVQTVVHGRWEVVHGVLTPGGDPLLRCPICKARESEHLCGVECRTVWNYCPNCGARMDGE